LVFRGVVDCVVGVGIAAGIGIGIAAGDGVGE